VDRALFRLAEWVPGLHDDLARWTLWSNENGIVSHESALAVHEIGELESARVHLTVPPGFRKRDAAVEVHLGEIPAADVVEHAGFRVTTATRSLVDVASRGVDEEQLARAIEDARAKGLLTPRQLRERAEAIDPRAALYVERALGRLAAS
jgi:predicted transcriptional regulator of viral defense system